MLKNPWHVYIIKTDRGTLYTGITVDVERRLNEHKHSKKGAKFFRTAAALELVFTQSCKNRSEASSLEAKIKKLRQKQKIELIQQNVVIRHSCTKS